MNQSPIKVSRALISVSKKEGVVELARGLQALGVEVISTGGTAKTLREAGVPVKDVSEVTGFPEMMNGRLKTLHPKVHGGILGLRDRDRDTARAQGIQWIDLVVCNLYPFAETIEKPNVSLDEVIENIDIGGPAMIRSAAKNMGWVTVAVDTADYAALLDEIKNGGVSFETRKRLATKAFGHTAQYDGVIHGYLRDPSTPPTDVGVAQDDSSRFPKTLTVAYTKLFNLRYGENPHQTAAVYREPHTPSTLLDARILQGKQLSYNNINDADGALATLQEFTDPACVVVKHANPCGVAVADDITTAFHRAYEADALAAFGGIIALNRACTKEIAEYVCSVFAEIVMAPRFDQEASNLFAAKKNLRLLELGDVESRKPHLEIRQVAGGLLAQDADAREIKKEELKRVTAKQPTDTESADMLFGWKVLKHVKSNAIVLAKDATTIGIGPGQVSRVDAVDIAIKKSGDKLRGAILASDAFFPFRDSIDKIVGTGITAIIQPGGSIKDQEVIDACDEYGLSMVFTGIRCFKH